MSDERRGSAASVLCIGFILFMAYLILSGLGYVPNVFPPLTWGVAP